MLKIFPVEAGSVDLGLALSNLVKKSFTLINKALSHAFVLSSAFFAADILFGSSSVVPVEVPNLLRRSVLACSMVNNSPLDLS